MCISNVVGRARGSQSQGFVSRRDQARASGRNATGEPPAESLVRTTDQVEGLVQVTDGSPMAKGQYLEHCVFDKTKIV